MIDYIRPESRDIVSQLAVSAGISEQPGHRIGNIAVAVSAPVQSARAIRAASVMQGFHDGKIAPTTAADKQRPLPHFIDQSVAQVI